MPVKKPCLAVQSVEKPMFSVVGGRGIIAAADFSQSLQSPNVPGMFGLFHGGHLVHKGCETGHPAQKTGVNGRFSPTSFLTGSGHSAGPGLCVTLSEGIDVCWNHKGLGFPRPHASKPGPLAVAVFTALVRLATPMVSSADDAIREASSRITIALEVRGELFAEATPDRSPVSQPITLDAHFAFVEQPIEGENAAVVRHYRQAAAAFQTGSRSSHTVLAADASEILVNLQGTTPLPFMANGFLSREEAELLDMPFDSLLVEGLRPADAVAESATWKVPADLTAGLLAIDTVESGSLDAILRRVDQGVAEVAFSGTVTGAVDGAPTRIVVEGGFRCRASSSPTEDTWLLNQQIEKLDVQLNERREAGWVAPGLDVTATLSMDRSADIGEPVDDELVPPAADRPQAAGRPGTVWERHRLGRYTLVVDHRWREVEDGPEGLVMRLMDRGALVAQCSILPLPRSAPDAAPSIETVRRDVERSLADQFGQITASEATTRGDGTRVVRIVAEGSAEDRPFCWIHHVLTGPEGHRAAVTCMFEPAMANRFAAADQELVAGFLLLPDPTAPPPREAQLPTAFQ